MVRRRGQSQGSNMASSGDTTTAAGELGDLVRTRMRSPSYGAELLHSLNAFKANDQLCDFTVCAVGGKCIKVAYASHYC